MKKRPPEQGGERSADNKEPLRRKVPRTLAEFLLAAALFSSGANLASCTPANAAETGGDGITSEQPNQNDSGVVGEEGGGGSVVDVVDGPGNNNSGNANTDQTQKFKYEGFDRVRDLPGQAELQDALKKTDYDWSYTTMIGNHVPVYEAIPPESGFPCGDIHVYIYSMKKDGTIEYIRVLSTHAGLVEVDTVDYLSHMINDLLDFASNEH